jgi:hypothetical protein
MLYQRSIDKKLLPKSAEKLSRVDAFVYAAIGW